MALASAEARPEPPAEGSERHRELLEVKAADKTKITDGETWYVVDAPWLVRWLTYVFDAAAPPPGPVDNDRLMTEGPGRRSLREGLTIKRDYRAVSERVWRFYLKNHGGGPRISFVGPDALTDPSAWSIDDAWVFASGGGDGAATTSGGATVTGVVVELLPHVHTLKCNRRVSVCDAPGKFREHERISATLAAGGHMHSADSTLSRRILWQRCPAEAASRPDAPWQRIPGVEGMATYLIRKLDAGCMIRAAYVRDGDETAMYSEALGPCEEAPPMVDSVKIEGETKVGAVLVAVTDYWGGTQGPSSYKWIRVKGGIRQNEGPFNIDGTAFFDPSNTEAGIAAGDPRFRLLKADDVGATFKVTCTPVRMDGVRGEPKTSTRTRPIEM